LNYKIALRNKLYENNKNYVNSFTLNTYIKFTRVYHKASGWVREAGVRISKLLGHYSVKDNGV